MTLCLPSFFKAPDITLVGTCGPIKFLAAFKPVLAIPCLTAKEVPPVKGAAKEATITVGSEIISIPASFTKPANCLRLPKSALSNSRLK